MAKNQKSEIRCPSCGVCWPAKFLYCENCSEILNKPKSTDKIVEITSEIEIRQFFGAQNYQNWNGLGRPNKPIYVNGQFYLDSHYIFFKRYGFQIPIDIYDLWLNENPRPPMEEWDLEQALLNASQTSNEPIKPKKFSELSGKDKTKKILKNAAIFTVGVMAVGANSRGNCNRCGMELTGNVCRYCQT
jgi:hypothetical protein